MLACDEQGRTALHEAAAAGQDTALYLLAAAGGRLDAGAGQPVGTPLEAAAAAGQAAALRTLLILGAQPSTTALLRAAKGGHLGCVQALLRTGQLKDVNATGVSGRTALDLATAGGHAACVEALLGAGARPQQAAPAAPTPLQAGQTAGDRAASRRKAAMAAAAPPAAANECLPVGASPAASHAGTHAARQPAAPPANLAHAAQGGSAAGGGRGSSARGMSSQQPGRTRAGGSTEQPGSASGACVQQLRSDAPVPSSPVAAGTAVDWPALTAAVAALENTALSWLAAVEAAAARWLAAMAGSSRPACPAAAAALRRLAGPCIAALTLLLRCLGLVERARRWVRAAVARSLVGHCSLEYRPCTQREYQKLLRCYNANPEAFQAAVEQPAYRAAGVISCLVVYGLPLLLLLVWLGGGGGASQLSVYRLASKV